MSGKAKHKQSLVTTNRTGGEASVVTVLAIAAALGGWLWWRRSRSAAAESGKTASRPRSQINGARSSFKFPSSKGTGSSSAKQQQQQQVFAPPAAPAIRAGGSRTGNPKKANKKQRQAEKQAKKEARQAGMELIHNAQLSNSNQDNEGPVTVKYVDLSKTSDIYDKVREYQETGRKRYP